MSNTASQTRLMELAEPLIEKSLDRAVRSLYASRKARLRIAIEVANRSPSTFWQHRYFEGIPGHGPTSTVIIVKKLQAQIDRQKRRISERHWSANRFKLSMLEEAMVFARYYRRFSQRVWTRKAA